MTLLNEYSEQKQTVEKNAGIEVEKEFQQYIDENGEERAIGYLNALYHVVKKMDTIVFSRSPNGNYHENTLAAIRRELRTFIVTHDDFLSSQFLRNFCEKNNIRRPKILHRYKK